MHTKSILIAIILIMVGFFYLHEMNPQRADFILDETRSINMPITGLVLLGFLAGVAAMVINSLAVDLKRVLKDFRHNRDLKRLDESEDFHRRGVEELLKGRSDRSVRALQKAFADTPEDIDVVLHLADAYAADGNLKEALTVLKSSIKSRGPKLELLFAVHRHSASLNDIQGAEKALNDILKIDDKNMTALKLLRDLYVGNANWLSAFGCEELILSLKPKGKELAEEKTIMAGLLYELSLLDYNENKLHDAIEKLDESLKSDSTFVPAYVMKSVVQTVDGKIHEAKKTLMKAVDRVGDSACYSFLEDLMVSEGMTQEMLNVYAKGVSKHPGDVDLKLLYARFQLTMDLNDSAMELLEDIFENEDRGFYVKALLAEAYSRKDLKDKALNLMKMSFDFEKDLSPIYTCSSCSSTSNEWQSRCENCGTWNSSRMNRKTLHTTAKEKKQEKIIH